MHIIPATVPFRALIYHPARKDVPEQVFAHNGIAWCIDPHDGGRPVPITVLGLAVKIDAVEDISAGCVMTSAGEWFKDRSEWLAKKRAG